MGWKKRECESVKSEDGGVGKVSGDGMRSDGEISDRTEEERVSVQVREVEK